MTSPKARRSSSPYIRVPVMDSTFGSLLTFGPHQHGGSLSLPSSATLWPRKSWFDWNEASLTRKWTTVGSLIFGVFMVGAMLEGKGGFYRLRSGIMGSESVNNVGQQGRSVQECNPFQKLGYLNYNASSVKDNIWVPYKGDDGVGKVGSVRYEECASDPSQLFGNLLDDLQRLHRGGLSDRGPRALPWLRNRTIVLLGDSIDRFHLRDFCDLLGASMVPPFNGISGGGGDASPSTPESPGISFPIYADDPMSPPPYRPFPSNPDQPPQDWPAGEESVWNDLRKKWEARGEILTRPWVCKVPSYDLMLVSVFTFGVEPKLGGHGFAGAPWYFPPAKATDRLHHILLPTLQSIATQMSRPHTVKPDLIEVSSGLWDMRQWTEEDFAAAHSPLDEHSEIPYASLSNERLSWWFERVQQLLQTVAESFPDATTPILWRSLHHPQRHYFAPWTRVAQLDDLGRWAVRKLKSEHEWASRRLRMNEWGSRMIGQEHHYRDLLHPAAVPGSVLWSDILLWELKRAVDMKYSLMP